MSNQSHGLAETAISRDTVLGFMGRIFGHGSRGSYARILTTTKEKKNASFYQSQQLERPTYAVLCGVDADNVQTNKHE